MLFRKYRKPLYVVLLLIALLIVAGYFLYRYKKHDFLKNDLHQLVQNKTDSLYNISYDSIAVDEVAGNLFIKNLHVVGDTVKQLEMIRKGDPNAAKAILDIYIPLLKVAQFKTAKALLAKQLQCSYVVINSPKVTVYFFPGQQTEQDEEKQKQQLYKQILGSLKFVQADSISITNAQVEAADYYTKESKFSTSNTTINLNDVKIDSTYNEDTSRTLFCKQIDIKSNKVTLGDKKKGAEITNASFNTRSKLVHLASFEYDAFKNNGFFKGKLENIFLEGIEWKGPVEKSHLVIRNAVLQKGDVEALTGNSENKKGAQNGRILTGWIKSFRLDRLNVKSFSVTSRSTDEKKKPIVIKNNSLLLTNVKIDTVAQLNESLVNRIGEVEFRNDNLSIISKDKMYEYKISGFKLNTKSRKVWMNQFAVIPLLNEKEFAKKSKKLTNRFDVKINNIEASGVDVSKLLKGQLYAGLVTSKNNIVKDYIDLSYPPSGESNVGKYPQQLLYKLKVPVKINKFTATHSYIEYKERHPESDSVGKVFFKDVDATANNITNLPPKRGEKTTVVFNSSFLGALPFNGSFIFYLDEWEKGTVKAQAAINKNFDGTILNQLSEPMSLIKINSGFFDYIKTELMVDNYTAKGTLTMAYRDFKISLLKKKNEGTNKKDVRSFLANAIIKNKNTSGPDMKVGNIDVKREARRSFFNFIWHSIFIGGQQVFRLKPNKKADSQ
jgi:hypothetical protein